MAYTQINVESSFDVGSAMPSVFVAASGLGEAVCSPFIDGTGGLNVVDSSTGDVIAVDLSSGQASVVMNSGGAPSGAAVNPDGDMFIADIGHAAVMTASEGLSPSVYCDKYEDHSFKGPNTVAFDVNGTMFFTDSGPLGETGIEAPTGSVYAITAPSNGQRETLKPLASQCLAHPCGVAAAPDGTFVYVCEMMQNRILRFFQRPTGVFHCSVFAQLSGGVGPSAVAVAPDGRLFVTVFDVDPSAAGRVVVVSPEGKVIQEITVAAADGTSASSELTGIALSSDKSRVYVTDGNSGVLFGISIA
eukprot:CAMPEP_0119543154 /NCGR_PEP_ID=MMETSP1344-20130328/53971_1 /TAXON_ID=236787 /ORGANISM="Florenciella parvula, Strain CCMP2471" /LENGTH=302 /DNA_ID=CAMNT_0007587429 /DNA_START=94 /DNA_END=1002 /DNA_ORIENTATION=-